MEPKYVLSVEQAANLVEMGAFTMENLLSQVILSDNKIPITKTQDELAQMVRDKIRAND